MLFCECAGLFWVTFFLISRGKVDGKLIGNFEDAKLWQSKFNFRLPAFVQCTPLHSVSEGTVIFRARYRPRWTTSSKYEFILLRTEKILADGTIIVLNIPLSYGLDPETQNKYIRGECLPYGYAIRPAAETASTITLFFQYFLPKRRKPSLTRFFFST